MKGTTMKAKSRVCELCDREATLYCDSDAAFLCSACDFNVHNANFLVARHVRRLICSECESITGYGFSGARPPSVRRLSCRSCSPGNEGGGEEEADSISCSSTLSLACISSAESQTRSRKEVASRKRNLPVKTTVTGDVPRAVAKAEGIFVIWCTKLGLNGDLVVPSATRAIGLCWARLSGAVPLRVSLAASFWLGVKLCGDKTSATWQNLRSLEEVSGVPIKLITALESKLEHFLKRSRQDLKEGWAES
ncbi:hypothetical protein K2173_010854 [Erythroxylum novogranatense]|uniref:B box-type domain-containing protein n=1 Tax=Erythroxylum novogranatense TaxID=1862640 RepID=A0AAV8T1A6_9ROSI|nr:hypothetical protein K2173_010854 [Erythroxylum novogranatense]